MFKKRLIKYHFFHLGGQKQAIRLSRKVTKHTNRMKVAISKYNGRLSVLKEHVAVPVKQVSFNDAKDIKSSIYGDLTSMLSDATKIPFEVKKRIIDLKELEKRCNEEERMLESECARLLQYKTALINEMVGKVQLLQTEGDRFSLGLSSMLMSHCATLKKKVFGEKDAYNLFGINITSSFVEPVPAYMERVWHELQFNPINDDSELSSSESESETEYIDEKDD